ncbi:hypothetical protein ACFLS1_11780 [Verrucomicrobiota bacterium]
MKLSFIIYHLLFSLLLLSGCGKAPSSTATSGEPLVKDMSHGPVEVIITAKPPRVELDKDIFLTIKVTTPPEIEVTLPQMDDRLQGFVLNGSFDKEPAKDNGKTTLERHVRLTPLLANEYRLAPMAIVFTDKSKSPAEKNWFATRPIIFEPLPVKEKTADNIEAVLAPIWIYPPLKSVAMFSFAAIICIGLAVLAWKVFKRIHREIELKRMSPKERALKELEVLLVKNLIQKRKIKEFYLQLTMIVRRYIERSYSVKAPEQTTEEFLTAVTHDPRFDSGTVAKLKKFLEAADLVKFAAYRPPDETAGKAANTAREYIEHDSKTEQERITTEAQRHGEECC